MTSIAEETSHRPGAGRRASSPKPAKKATRAPQARQRCEEEGQVGQEGHPGQESAQRREESQRRRARAARPTKVLDLLKRPGGVTAKELMKATGWQPHSVRGFLSGTIGKKMGLTVTSTKGEDGERSYSIKG